jgi:hypothetical protein
VIVADEKVKSLKSVKAVVPELEGSTLVKVPPPALYPVPDTSLVAAHSLLLRV